MVPSIKQSITGDNNKQFNAETITYNNFVDQERVDQGVIQDIFKYVIENCHNNELIEKARPEALLKTQKKINKNFKGAKDRQEIIQYCKLTSGKISLIEKAFSNLDSQEQNDVHTYILSRYNENKREGLDNLNNFFSLFKRFIPPQKSSDPTYENIAKSFVLFFFQDCTIFEKLREEQKQLKLEL